jgi:hypothetical protein
MARRDNVTALKLLALFAQYSRADEIAVSPAAAWRAPSPRSARGTSGTPPPGLRCSITCAETGTPTPRSKHPAWLTPVWVARLAVSVRGAPPGHRGLRGLSDTFHAGFRSRRGGGQMTGDSARSR